MRAKSAALMAALLVVVATQAQTKKERSSKTALLRQIAAARTVAVVVYPETDAFARKQSGEDRRVQAEVEQKIRGWKRYIFTQRIADADIVIAVRKGAYAKPRVGVETSTSHPPQLSVGTDAGPNQDMLVVYRGGPDAFDASPLWRDLSDHGLEIPVLPAVDRLKADLDRLGK
jgi:hypothetical protein